MEGLERKPLKSGSNFYLAKSSNFELLQVILEGMSTLKRWQEYTELYKKDLHDPENHDGVIIHLEPDILAFEVKQSLGSITTNKASGGDGIPVDLFQIREDDVVKVLH